MKHILATLAEVLLTTFAIIVAVITLVVAIPISIVVELVGKDRADRLLDAEV